MKKIFLIIFLVFLFLIPQLIEAGLVPCGPDFPPPDNVCQLCHIFILFDNILKFIFFTIVPPLAILMIAIAGAHFLLASGNPSTLAQGKTILRGTGIALIIIYGAWVIVSMILTFPGLIDPNWGWDPSKWFQINCPTGP